MSKPTKRGRGRPPLSEGERPAARMVRLPPDLDREAERMKGALSWSEWLRGLVERAVSDPRGGR